MRSSQSNCARAFGNATTGSDTLGRAWNHKRVHRVYCEMQLNQKRRTRRRLPAREAQSLLVIPEINVVWALDFMHDALYGRRPFRILNVIDEANRGALGIDVATSIPATRVIRFLEQLTEIHGRPKAIRCDNGSERWSRAVGQCFWFLKW
jgi:putative transposase